MNWLPDSQIVEGIIWMLTRITIETGVLVVAAISLLMLAGKWISPRWRCAIWLLIFVRLMLPTLPASPLSVFTVLYRLPEYFASPVVEKPFSISVIKIHYTAAEDNEPVVSSSNPIVVVPTETAFEWSWQFLILAVWAMGVIMLLGWMIIAHARFARRLSSAESTTDAIQQIWQKSCVKMGVKRMPRLLITDAAGPAVFGVFRPSVLIPRNLLIELSAEQLRFVFLHELAHIRRYDTRLELFAAVVRALHWFNPLAWYAMSRLRAEREVACDEMVLLRTEPSQQSEYGQAVLVVASRLFSTSSPAIPMMPGKSGLKRRITMISHYRTRKWGNVFPLCLVGLLASCTMTSPAQNVTELPDANAEPAAIQTITPTTLPAAEESPANKAAKEALAKSIPEIRFDSVAFSDVIDFLRDTQSVNIFVNWKTLEAAGIDRATPVNLRVRNVKVEKALRIILSDVGANSNLLDFRVDDGVVTISTKEDFGYDVVTKTYDIRDLLVVIPDFTEAKDKSETPSRRDLVDQIIALLTDTIGPETWKQNGGRFGSIQELGGQLIVTHTDEVHSQIAALLGKLREQRSIQVAVDTRFLTLDPTLVPSQKELEGKAVEHNSLKDSSAKMMWFLNDEQAKKLIAAAGKNEKSSTLTSPRITLFNGQTARIAVTRPVSYVSTFVPATQPTDKSKWTPAISTVESGLTYEVTATVSADRKYATLTMKPTITRLIGIDSKLFTLPDGSKIDGLFVQNPTTTKQEINTTVSIPDGGTLLMSGLNWPASDDPSGSKPVYMLVKPNIIIQREVEQATFPLLQSEPNR